jgi:putative SOS response-associated peptidase YedK
MCGRYASSRNPQQLVELFDVERVEPKEALAPSWNVAPTDAVWAVLERPEPGGEEPVRQLRALRWGLVPSWAKDPAIGSRMINARMETLAEKPAFKRAFARRRCLLPADGFYEWEPLPQPEDESGRKGRPRKQPYFIHPEDGSVMAMAGLYEFWRDPQFADDDDPDAWLVSCTIITTEATDAAGRIHPRMPLAIPREGWGTWLDRDEQDLERLRSLLAQPAAGHLAARPVSTAVNNVRNNGPQLLDEVPVADA